jgi:HEAT repeat protein/energy-coupling factor transporter ATP-binding protein EcfA2
LTPLEDLLQQCTVKIIVPGGWGTGFFVATGLILTCAHVVRNAADGQVTVIYPGWQQPLSAIVKATADDGKTLDLALVELSEPLPDHPCVLLDEEPVAIGQALYSYGYLESYANAAPVRPVHEGLTGDTPPLLKLQGAQIERGISGAALLNLQTGKVCGMVKETRAAGFDLGGGAMPTRVILAQFPELRELQRVFHGGDRRWVECLAERIDRNDEERVVGDKIGGGKGVGNQVTVNDGQGMQVNQPQAPVIQTGDHATINIQAPLLRANAADIDFQPYLEAVIRHYSQQRPCYTATDALLPLEAQCESQEREEDGPGQPAPKVEEFAVLEGLRKYALGAQREHVLLSGRPGSGKSTALQQLTVALAEEGQVPVLVQLKGDRPISDLLQAEFRRMKQRVTSEQIDEWLLSDRLVLLLDGVNEIPNDALRRSLLQFREDNPTVPMIFTTRELSLGGDLGIGKRLEMKPLSESQMREFVGQYLPGQGDRLLGQLRDRLREIAETPLLLKMLCDVFRQTGAVPQSKGDLFRRFDSEYERFKGLPAVSEDFRRFKSELLQQLAWMMMQGNHQQPTEFELTIDRTQAEKWIEHWLQPRVSDPATKAKEWLEDLLEHHLLQVAANPKQIEFHHQLFQEYYAAEALLVMFKDRHPAVSDKTRFQQSYLNYLKWTEVIAMALSFMQDEAQAVEIVQQALEVDLRLGARLAGEVKPVFQQQTVHLVEALLVPSRLKVELLEVGRSEFSIPGLLKAIEDSNSDVRSSAAEALGKLGSEAAIPALLKAIEHSDSDVRRRAADALGQLGSEAAIPGLLKAIEHSDSDVRMSAAEALGKLGSEAAIPALLKAIEHSDFDVRYSAADELGRLGSEAAIPGLLKAIEHSDSDVRSRAAEALGELGSEAAIPGLLKAIEDSDSSVRGSAAYALGRLGSEAAIPGLLKAIEDSNSSMRRRAAEALGKLGSEAAIPALLKAIEHSNSYVRRCAADALGQLGSEAAIPALLKAIEDSDSSVRSRAADALGKLGSEAAIPALLKAIEDSDSSVRSRAADALGKLGSEAAIPALLKAIEDSDYFVRSRAAEALGKLGSEAAIPGLLKAIEDSNSSVPRRAAKALGELGSEAAIPALLKAIKHSDFYVRRSAAEALDTLAKNHAQALSSHLPHLLTLIPTAAGEEADRVILAIQTNCKFYNYSIQNEKLNIKNGEDRYSGDLQRDRPNSQERDPISTTNPFPNVTEVKIFENIQTYHEAPPKDPPS